MNLSKGGEKKNLETMCKQSDFSIDHILNRAGENASECRLRMQTVNFYPNFRRHSYHHVNNNNSNSSSNSDHESDSNPISLISHTRYHHHEDSSNIPMFSWLQYTRFRPPKLPRTIKLGPVKRTPGRLPRVPFSTGQLQALEDAYKLSTYLSSEEANKLADNLHLTSTRVKIWFQNRRARERREKREMAAVVDSSCNTPEIKLNVHR